jgi:endonuclease-3
MDELISCILSQHTSDATSFPTFHALRRKVPQWADVVALGPEKLADLIRPAGLANQKARSIIAVLREIESRNGDYDIENLRDMDLEDARSWLLSLPGVGPKTAAIVLCFAFGRPAIPVDTHVFRVSWRLGLIEKSIGEAKAHRVLEGMVPEDLAYRFHTALIQHGRQICKAPKPNCSACPLKRRCRYYKTLKAK